MLPVSPVSRSAGLTGAVCVNRRPGTGPTPVPAARPPLSEDLRRITVFRPEGLRACDRTRTGDDPLDRRGLWPLSYTCRWSFHRQDPRRVSGPAVGTPHPRRSLAWTRTRNLRINSALRCRLRHQGLCKCAVRDRCGPRDALPVGRQVLLPYGVLLHGLEPRRTRHACAPDNTSPAPVRLVTSIRHGEVDSA